MKDMFLISWVIFWIGVFVLIIRHCINDAERSEKKWDQICRESKEIESIAEAERERPMNQCYKTNLHCHCVGLCKEGY
jgi:hypothetical protein